ncbi:hypothetical protein NQ315_003267 [Exocentrus adspersus]|uniref:DDE Tnp4 domain-containing protein n=1 Tax=Exocentrus adspersus TaxID=1586481 RepID=A0AAV8VCU8_9CUCU|nr:hypothetical protein NQ315_003267 [Exocentrus adspersus]
MAVRLSMIGVASGLAMVNELQQLEFSMYPSATEADFHPPCLFKTSIDAPESANSDAEVLRKQCPLVLVTMDPIYMNLMLELQEQQQRAELRIERRHLRDHANDLVRTLIRELTPHMDSGERVTKISIGNRVLGALRFFAQGAYQRGVGNEMMVAMAQQTFSTALSEVCNAIEIIAPNWIQFPAAQAQKDINKLEFMRRFEFPGVVGCIDCTHIAITAPIICDSNLLILNINPNFGGATHDAFIWRNSVIKHHLEDNYQRGERNTWLLGDSGYPQEPWLMTPVLNAPPDSPEGRYNAALVRARTLKMRFRCLLKERVLKYHPHKAGEIINACCVLHNMCVRANVPLEDELVDDGQFQPEVGVNVLAAGDIVPLGQQHREEVINLYFR